MTSDDDFVPRLGRMRAGGKGKQAKKFLGQILAAANLARGAGGRQGAASRFDGSRIGRGAGVGRILGSRDHYGTLRQRRVIVKSRIVKLAGKGFAAAHAHMRYVERDGTTRDGGRGHLYGADADHVDGKSFLEAAKDDRHQFRLIVSPEDGAEYDDLKSLTRRLMARVEQDLGTGLDWVAVDHFNTAHPHTHIMVRARDDRGKDLIIAREYIVRGMRERAAELIDLDLGPRTSQAIEEKLRREVEQERLTSIDRTLLREADRNLLVTSTGRDAFDQTMRMGRLRKLERLGLAGQVGATHWRLAPDLADTLSRMGERGDIIRTMQRAYTSRADVLGIDDQSIYDPAAAGVRPLVGRIAGRGLSDELNDRHYLLVEATDGRTHYVAIGKGENFEACANGAIVRIEPIVPAVREADRTVALVAAANCGRYDVDAHLRHDPAASEAFAETHVRRLEAMRRLTRGATRELDGTWIISPDHLDRAAAYEIARAKDRPVSVEILSSVPLAQLVEADAATWLDEELVAAEPQPVRDARFGHEVREAQARRRQWLVTQGLAEQDGNRTIYRAGLIQTLRRRELVRVGAQLSREMGKTFLDVAPRGQLDGVYRRRIDALGGKYALIERSHDFTLVPWRPVLERHVGKTVSGIIRGDGVSWSVGRGRGGPSIS